MDKQPSDGETRPPEKPEKPWMIRDVPPRTRRAVKMFAVAHDITLAEALEQLIDIALGTLGSAAPRTSESPDNLEHLRPELQQADDLVDRLQEEIHKMLRSPQAPE